MKASVGSIKTLAGFLSGLKPRTTRAFTPNPEYISTPWGRISLSLYPHAVKSVVVISADFEMAWAWRYAKRKPASATNMGLLERQNFPVILELFNSLNAPVTWATVGHLFLSSCSNEQAKPHHNLPRIPYFTNRHWSYTAGDWFDDDPCSDYKSDPAWYAPDLIQLILDSPIQHEIGCHSFSHLDLTYERCPDDVAKSEIELCLKIAAQYGITLRSMVFPGGTRGHFDILRDTGFTSYRGRPQPKIEMNYPVRTKFDLWEIPTATIIGGGLSTNFNPAIAKWILRKYLKTAVQQNLVSHFWFHPSCDRITTLNLLPRLIEEIAFLRKSGETCIMTMESLADYCETRSNATIKINNIGFIISSDTKPPFKKTSLSLRINNKSIIAVSSSTGSVYQIHHNNGCRVVDIPPCEFDNVLKFESHNENK